MSDMTVYESGHHSGFTAIVHGGKVRAALKQFQERHFSGMDRKTVRSLALRFGTMYILTGVFVWQVVAHLDAIIAINP